jgi:hypothetical protein
MAWSCRMVAIEIWPGQIFKIAQGLNSRASKLVPVGQNLHKSHIYGPIQSKFAIKFRHNTVEVWGGSIMFYHPRDFEPNWAWSFGIPLGMIYGGQFISPEWSIPGVKPRFRWVITCIKATFMDRFKTNLALSFCITLWRFEESQLFFITRGVITPRSKPVFGGSKPVSGGSNLYWGHICRPVRTRIDTDLYYGEGLVPLGQHQMSYRLYFEATSEVLTDWIRLDVWLISSIWTRGYILPEQRRETELVL